MKKIKKLLAIGFALDCLIVTYGTLSVEKDGFSIIIITEHMTESELIDLTIAVDVLLESHGFVVFNANKNGKEYRSEELDVTISLTIF